MNFENEFAVPAPPSEVWGAMMDFERVAPCMPGAEVTERVGDDAFKVQVRVKVGPMSMTYRGQAEITDRDDQAMTAAMRVQAREARGQGTANATVQMRVQGEGASTKATMDTELKLSGRAAAMGRGVIADVSQALVSEFAQNLAQMVSGESTPQTASPATEASPPPAESPPRPPAGAPTPPPEPAPPPPPPGATPPQASSALDAGQLARTVVVSRLREPRAALMAGGVIAVVSVAVGFKLGRRLGSR
jgi:carbon monoxide dehydrogenase subunit G